jgi:Flp pilus assembly pilin Flp
MMQPLNLILLRLLYDRCFELLAGTSDRGERGQDLIEYALIVGFIAVACAALIPYTASDSMRSIYSKIADVLTNSTSQT